MKNHAAISVKNPTKSIWEDASFAEKIIIGNNEYILLILADGGSRAPKDWLASRSTVTFISEKLAQSSLPTTEALKAIETANENIVSGAEDTLGILSTVSAIPDSLKNGQQTS